MTKAIEVITSVQRRRRWSRAEKERIVAAAIEQGAVASAGGRDSCEPAVPVAAGAVPFRAEHCSAPTFSAVTIAPAASEPTGSRCPICIGFIRPAKRRSSIRLRRPIASSSHFDGQDALESGLVRPGETDTGWLNRALADDTGYVRRRAVTPLIVRGKAPVLS